MFVKIILLKVYLQLSYKPPLYAVRFFFLGDIHSSIGAAQQVVSADYLDNCNILIRTSNPMKKEKKQTKTVQQYTFTPNGLRLFLPAILDRGCRQALITASHSRANCGPSSTANPTVSSVCLREKNPETLFRAMVASSSLL